MRDGTRWWHRATVVDVTADCFAVKYQTVKALSVLLFISTCCILSSRHNCHPPSLGSPVLPRQSESARRGPGISAGHYWINKKLAMRPLSAWHLTQDACTAYNEVRVCCVVVLLYYYSSPTTTTTHQTFGTNYAPFSIRKKHLKIRVFRTVMMSGREYYLALSPSDDLAATLHTITIMPPSDSTWQRPASSNGALRPVEIAMRGDLGVVPAYNCGILLPHWCPNVTYTVKPGRHSSLDVSTYVTWTNSFGHIVR